MKNEQKKPLVESANQPQPSLNDLYRKKGELTTVIEVAQLVLQQVNALVAQKLQEMRVIPMPPKEAKAA